MKDIIKLGAILTLVSVIAAAALSGVNNITKPLILAEHQKELLKSKRDVLPDAATGFKITATSLKDLKSKNIPDEVIQKLRNHENQAVIGKEEFLNLLKKTVGEEQISMYDSVILECSPDLDTDTFDTVTDSGNTLFYIGYNSAAKNEIAGYVFIARGKGYSSVIETLVGVDTSWNIKGLKILQQVETPGLGTKIVEEDFTQPFIGKLGEFLAVDKDGGEIQSITGATISSRAFTNSVKHGITELKKNIANYQAKLTVPDSTGSKLQ